jgi:periplasmic protein TonB
VLISLWAPVTMPEPPELLVSIPVPRFRNVVQVHSTSVERSVSAPAEPRRFQFVPPSVRPLSNATSVDAMVDGLPNVASDTGLFVNGTGHPFVPNAIPAPPPPPAPPKPKPVPETVSRVQVGGDVLASKLLQRVNPVYPEIARRARIQGVVQLHGIITKEGRIAQLRVLSGHPMLVKAALDAVGQWVYSPTFLNKQPVEVEAPIEVRFILAQ